MKLRVSHVIVHPILIWDDGEELSPGPQTQPAIIPLSALPEQANRIRAEIAAMEKQLVEQGGPGPENFAPARSLHDNGGE